MKKPKKVISALLAMIMLASVPMPVLAAAAQPAAAAEESAEEETTTRYSLFGELVRRSAERRAAAAAAAEENAGKAEKTSSKSSAKTASEEKTTAKKRKTAAEIFGTNKVANIYLLVSAAQPDKPHVWIYVENISDKPITVGHYTVPVGDSVSIGAWRDRGRGAGIHYNLERYWVKADTYDRTVYLKATVTAAELRMVTMTINSHDYWTYPFNCGWFATCVWNKTTLKFVPYLFWPQFIRAAMYLIGAKPLDFVIKKLGDPSKTYKHTSDGKVVMNSSALWTNTGV